MSFRGRYPTRFRRSGGFKKSFTNEKEFGFKRKFHEERGSFFKRPRGASSFHRKESDLERPQADYDRGRGQWTSRRPRGRNLRSPRSRFMRGRHSYNEQRGKFNVRQHFERPGSPEWFEEEDEFDSNRPLHNRRSSRTDYSGEEDFSGFDESFNRRSRSPLIIRRTFGEDSPERYSREKSFERRDDPSFAPEHIEERIFDGHRSRSRSHRSRSLEKYDKVRDRNAGRSSPPFRGDARHSQFGRREGSFDKGYSPNRNHTYIHNRESRRSSFERNAHLRSPERTYDRRNASPNSTTSNGFQKHRFSESGDTSRHRRPRSGSEASYHSSCHYFLNRNNPSQEDNLFQNYDSPTNRRQFSAGIRELSEERRMNSPSRLESRMRSEFERHGPPFEMSYHQRQSAYKTHSPRREFSNDMDEIFSKRSFSHENIEDRNLMGNDSGYFVERQRMKRVFNDERRRGHEKRSESSIERFLNDCKKSVERRPDSSRVSSPRETNRDYDYEIQQYRSHSSQRKFHGPDQIVIERGRSFERSLSPNSNNTYGGPKNVLGSPTEWGNVKKQIVSEFKELSTDITVSDNKQIDKLDDEQLKETNEQGKTTKVDKSQQSCNSNPHAIKIKEQILGTESDSVLQNKKIEDTNDCGNLNLSPISQNENFEPKEPPEGKELEDKLDLSPISQSSLGFKESPIKTAQANYANIELSPISQHETFDQTEIADHNLDLSPISQPGSFEKREFSLVTDNLSGLSPISQNSLAREKESTYEKKGPKSSESCDSMQEFLKELERSCERSRSVSESSFEYKMKMSCSKINEQAFPVETNKSNPKSKSMEAEQSQFASERKLEPQNANPKQYEFQPDRKYTSKITYKYPAMSQSNQDPCHNQNEISTSNNDSTRSLWQIKETTRNSSSTKMMSGTGKIDHQQLLTMGYNHPHTETYNPLTNPDHNQNQLATYNLNPYNQVPNMQDHGPVVLESTIDFQRKPRENPSQNQHVLQVLGPKTENESGQPINLPNQTPQTVGTKKFRLSFNKYIADTIKNKSNQVSNFMSSNQNSIYSQNISYTPGQSMYDQNEFVNVANQNSQISHWNLANQRVPLAPGGSMLNFNSTMDLNQPDLLRASGLPPCLPLGSESNLNYLNMSNYQIDQFSSGIQNANLHSSVQSSQYLDSNLINQPIPSSQNLTGSFSETHLGTFQPSYENRPAILKNKPFKAPTVVDIRKCFSGTFGYNYLSFLNTGIQEFISISDDEGAEGGSQDHILLNPTFLDQYKNSPPSAEEMAQMLDGFVIFFDAKTNSELEKDPFVVIHESFAKSNRFGNLQAEETTLYVDFLPVPKKVCVLRWQGLMLARGESYTLVDARRKASISLINALAQNFYTVQTKYSYYCGGKLPKFMIKTKEQPGVYKVVERDEIIKAVTEVLKEMKQKGVFTGRGVDATSIKVVLDFIDSFFQDKTNFCELLFGGKGPMDYTLQDLKEISNHVKRLNWLQCRTIGGYGRGSFTAVSRVHTPQQLCNYLLANGGETVRYKLLPPQGPWIELLTSDAQYHPAIIKTIPKTPDNPHELSRRYNQITGGFGTSWGKQGKWM